MKTALLIVLMFAQARAANPPLTGFPFTDETLNYNISWAGGIRLGEAHLHSKHSADGWSFEFSVDAGVPGYPVKDSYTAHANEDFCSADFSKKFVHGARKGGEVETIDRSHETVSRVTNNGGGKSDFPVSDCIRDGLTLLYYARRELGQGRVAPAQQMLFGGLYQSRLDYAGAQTIQMGEQSVVTDKVVGSVKGPSSNLQFDIYFARDPARTPLRFTVPLAIGSFSMELVR